MTAANCIHFEDLGLSPVLLDLGFFQLRWYAISYIATVALGWAYLRRLVAQPGAPQDAPMSRAHVDDIWFWIAVGILLGGRLGYSLFYRPEIWLQPWQIFEVWKGGMSLHGGLIGVLIALVWFARRNRLDLLRICDYIATVTPVGLFLIRMANFVNGELWGRPSTLPWAMIFPGAGDGIPRHPSTLYEAIFEGLLSAAVLSYMFWRTDARYKPGRLLGTGLLIYGTARFLCEFTRQPDAGLENLWWGLTMGQTLCLPMIAAGLWFLIRSFNTPAKPATA